MKLLSFATASLFSVALGLAQTSAIEGDVKDESGQPLKNGTMVFDREDAKAKYHGTTTNKGHYFFLGLPVGNYTVSVVVDGKTLAKVIHVRTRAGDPVVVNIDLGDYKQLVPSQMGTDKDTSSNVATRANEQFGQMFKNKALNETFNGGMNALRLRDYSAAVLAFERVIETEPGEAFVWSSLGEAYLGMAGVSATADQSLVSKASQAFRRAIAIKPDDAALHGSYARVLATGGKSIEAQIEATKAAKIDPLKAGKYYYDLGGVWVNVSERSLALVAFKKAADAGYAEAYYQYGILLIGKAGLGLDGRVKLATGTVESLQKYLQLAPDGLSVRQACAILSDLDTPPTATCQMQNKQSLMRTSATLPIQQGMADSSLSTGQLRYTVQNQTAYFITVTVSGPTTYEFRVGPGEIKSMTMQGGTYSLQTVAAAPNVVPLGSTFTFQAGYVYRSTITVN